MAMPILYVAQFVLIAALTEHSLRRWRFTAVGRAGADFKRQFTVESYRQFFLDAGYGDVTIQLAEERIPCAVAVMRRQAGTM